jgi:hypothetical protein
MADLKPIGSEKLQGQEKIKRIMEIARYKENIPNNLNETSKSYFAKQLSDGNSYEIVKEKLGYVIKKHVTESELDYIEPMKNRKYYQSYSQALKRLNLIAGEVSRLNGVDEQTSLFGEQKKYVLKTPKVTDDEEEQPSTPPEPPQVPQPSLPPSPETQPAPDEEMPAPDEEMPAPDEEMPAPDEEMPAPDEEMSASDETEGTTFRMIQKLTGKLTQKIRDFDNDKGLTSENMKYVINMVLSSMDLSSLSEEDKEDIMMKFEGEEGENEMEVDSEEMGSEYSEEPQMGDENSSEEIPQPSEPTESKTSIFDGIFGESRVDKVISKYFQVTPKEKKFLNENISNRKRQKRMIVESKMKSVIKLTETYEQELASQKFLEENTSFIFVGKTNKKNLVFENKNEQIKITPEGYIL